MCDGRREEVNVYLSPPPAGLEREFNDLMTPEAVQFLVELSLHFQSRIDELYAARLERRCAQRARPRIPKFRKLEHVDDDWKVAPVSQRLQNRHLDLGDVSPSDLGRFTAALNARVQGIQVDFDDGHCPSWVNQLSGLHNVYRAVRDEIPNAPRLPDAPVLMLRPRAWNMLEHNASVSGRALPGPLFDFGLLVHHNGARLARQEAGPFFYLSKLESAAEARLWNDIFAWSELRLRLAHGAIKACVLIENVLAAFELEGVLYALRERSLGLNCGIWDYAASIIAHFGTDGSFLLPDRGKYVSMDRPFLRSYMDLVVRTCHRRGAHATGGMSARLLPDRASRDFQPTVRAVLEAKLAEIRAGVDGFMVYDLGLVEPVNQLWARCPAGELPNQIGRRHPANDGVIVEADLLRLPKGGVTEAGLRHNITVGTLFVYHWLCGRGVFQLGTAIEDSATAEISRAQVWQWIRHGAPIEDEAGRIVTRGHVREVASDVHRELIGLHSRDRGSRLKLGIAHDVFLQIVNQRDFPDFITTYLNDAYIFRKMQANL